MKWMRWELTEMMSVSYRTAQAAYSSVRRSQTPFWSKLRSGHGRIDQSQEKTCVSQKIICFKVPLTMAHDLIGNSIDAAPGDTGSECASTGPITYSAFQCDHTVKHVYVPVDTDAGTRHLTDHLKAAVKKSMPHHVHALPDIPTNEQ